MELLAKWRPRIRKPYRALLLTGAHGIAGWEHSGHLGADEWRTSADELVGTLIRMVTAESRP
ncbi:hypothetical protein [Lentzea sp. CC55]|uniref:hypothetical protein n=1 Tax=Lentzea sp. CC55 TaxID=2884909 RepID=UPI001F400DFB|nr:hypothetical protein [Lentzea sp. CC55]MCG8927678.1 hypothetical protein [Lentzea sp. CC55]